MSQVKYNEEKHGTTNGEKYLGEPLVRKKDTAAAVLKNDGEVNNIFL